ncbi:uncharacterized protein LOC121877080 [Homarus americanus]|uniref:Uncharacterized protein n=1 Tax=Homarus americanus TaxID=6706 RepID=A0A8J5JV57_HOMAM|nr:uncharacterized protein LOC121877080 [Homarus americanus]XP_042238651.1 uncharacterized protein LOC121877080 [Homarus americanus]KAG7159759.1 hypothetical protein Hamer_G021140 [Homarus americanus]
MRSHVLLVVLGAALTASSLAKQVPMENTFYQLDCPGNGQMAYFLLHGIDDALPVDFTDEELTVFANGSIIFKSIKIHHEGTHLCMRRQSVNKMRGHPVSVKVRPQPPNNLWGEVYESQFLTGLVAALVISSVFALSCLVYKFQWRPVNTDNATEPIVREDGYDNPAMVNADDIEASNTKM